MMEYTKLGCLFIIILTHGEKENLRVYGVDDVAISCEKLLEPIRSASTGNLRGVPKILLVQVDKTNPIPIYSFYQVIYLCINRHYDFFFRFLLKFISSLPNFPNRTRNNYYTKSSFTCII